MDPPNAEKFIMYYLNYIGKNPEVKKISTFIVDKEVAHKVSDTCTARAISIKIASWCEQC
jgi:hypothetical protein